MRDERAAALQAHVVDLLGRTRHWTATAEVEEGTVMSMPGGGTRLVVSRNWGATGNTDIVRNGASYAYHKGKHHGGAVLAALSQLGPLGRLYVEPFEAHGLEVLQEQDLADMAGACGLTALERYQRILRESTHPGRSMLEPRTAPSRPPRTGVHDLLNDAGDVVARRTPATRTIDVTMPRSVAVLAARMPVRTDRDGPTTLSAWIAKAVDEGYKVRYGAAADKVSG